MSYYGEIKSFETTDAKISTLDAQEITAVSAILSGRLNGVSDMIENDNSGINYGVILSVYNDENQAKNGKIFSCESSNNEYNTTIKGLLPAKTYYYLTYMDLSGERHYGDLKSFTTSEYEPVYVNLGLSVKWASCNLGAISEEETGGLFGWGDLTGINVSSKNSDYVNVEDISETENDICILNNAGKMPTYAEYKELIDNCKKEWTSVKGINGYKFTASNGNSIFLPVSGLRDGYDIEEDATLGAYWSGSIDATANDYAYNVNFSESKLSLGTSQKYMGLAIRPVAVPIQGVLECANGKIVYGNIENNTNIFRIEIFNAWGATQNDPAINLDKLVFDDNCVIKFKVSGMKFKDGASGKYRAGMEFASSDWGYDYWSNGSAKYDCEVTGDGEYTVWCETNGKESNGATVFCIDIMDDIYPDLVDPENISIEILSIELNKATDWITKHNVDNSKILFSGKDGGVIDGRIEIYNEYGDTKNNPGVDISLLDFYGRMSISFTISGIDGNLKADASKNYNTEISYADYDWYPSYWGGGKGATTVTGDGTYNLYVNLLEKDDSGNDVRCNGAVVWCIELYNLWQDLVDPSLVKVEINSITTEL